MATTDIKTPLWLSPPGDTILEHIDFIGMSQAEFAERMGKTEQDISDLLKGAEPITRETASQLENVLGIPVSFWIEREQTYRQELYQWQQQEKLPASKKSYCKTLV